MTQQLSDYARYIHASRYARFNDAEGRRETWEETVARFCNFWQEKHGDKFPRKVIYDAIVNMEVMPSMRALMTAGKALDLDNVAGYNCSYLPIDHPRAFDEVMYILMCGTGVGFSVENKYVNRLPAVSEQIHGTETTITVADSRTGWASAFRELVSLLYSGRIPRWDVSKIRPAGSRLKTFGGRASGPEPLESLFRYTVELFKRAAGRKLTSIEAHDLVCKIADVVIVGGVRRSALISLSDLGDTTLRNAKNGNWWETDVQRALANNSAVYEAKPDLNTFLYEWTSLYESHSGERGIFNRAAATKQAESSGRRDTDGWDFGTNPCGEIILRPNGLCNLTEVVVRPTDDFESLKRKVRIATILGTFQSTLTDFRYLRSAWKRNAEEERLLGVSFTGIYDNFITREAPLTLLHELKQHAIETNQSWAKKLGINQSAAITCVKPSGTVSQLVGCSSGIHPAYSNYYVRNVRSDVKDPMTAFLKSQGVPWEPDVTKPEHMVVFSFPMKAPDHTKVSKEVTAMEHLRLYQMYRTQWCEHNPSITVYYRDEEFLDVGSWVYRNFDSIGGIAFLPHNDHIYQQAPYVEITKEEYESRMKAFPKIEWDRMKEFETVDTATGGYQEFACSAGACEI